MFPLLLPSLFWKRMHLKLAEWETKPQQEYGYGRNVFMWSKKKKYLSLLTALLFMKTMKNKNVWLVGETCSTRRRLQAALVCTVRKRCSLGNYSKPKQANYKTQCNIGKYKANDVITRKRLQGNSALWFARFSIKSHRVWWTRGRWGASGRQPKGLVRSVTIKSINLLASVTWLTTVMHKKSEMVITGAVSWPA